MLEEYLVTDMAADAMERQSLTDIASAKQLSYGIVKRTADLTSPALAKRLGREAGVYVTFDAPPSALFSDRALRSLANHLAGALVGLTGVQGAGSRVLAVGLGNDEIAADRLGDAAVKLLRVTPASAQGGKRRRVRLSAFSAGAEGVKWWRRPGTTRMASALYVHDGNDAPPPSHAATQEMMSGREALKLSIIPPPR